MAVEPDGGDPACWLDRVCDRCGRFIEDPAEHECPAAAPVSPSTTRSPEP